MRPNAITPFTWPVSHHAGLVRVTLLRLALGVLMLTGLVCLLFGLWLAQLTLG